MIDLVTILTLLGPIPIAAALYGLCLRLLHSHGRARLSTAVAVETSIAADHQPPAVTNARASEIPAVADARRVA